MYVDDVFFSSYFIFLSVQRLRNEIEEKNNMKRQRPIQAIFSIIQCVQPTTFQTNFTQTNETILYILYYICMLRCTDSLQCMYTQWKKKKLFLFNSSSR